MDIQGVIQHFTKQFPFLSNDDISSVLELAQFKVLKKDENFVNDGDTRREIAFIVKGLIRIFTLRDGVDYTFSLIAENEIIGNFESILLGQHSTRYFTAIEDTTLIVIDHDRLDKVLAENGKLDQARIGILQQNLAKALQRSEHYVLYNPEERYLNLLKENADIAKRVPLKYIASFLGITPVSLSRIRKRLNR